MEEGIKLKKRVEVFFVGLLVAFLAASLRLPWGVGIHRIHVFHAMFSDE